MNLVLFIAVPEVLQDGRGRKAAADAESAAGQHFAGLQKGRKGRTRRWWAAATAVKGCKVANTNRLDCIVLEAHNGSQANTP